MGIKGGDYVVKKLISKKAITSSNQIDLLLNL
jgi:hypothetical protein